MESLHRSPRATGTSRDGAAASSASPSCSRRCARRIRAAREAPRGAGRPGRLAARSENGHLETGRRAIVAPMETIWGLDAEALNRARISRDARFDGKFYIAVTSTGIYCRPICPSRYAKRSNVRFFGSPAAAEAAGFRPCLRCRPEAAPGTPAWLGTAAVVRRALRLINEGALDEDSVEALAGRLGIGARHLLRLFGRHVGASPVAVAQTRRLHFAVCLLTESSLPITQIALAAGFGSCRRFNDAFRHTYGRAPRELRQAGRRSGVAESAEEVALRLAYRPPYDWSHLRDFLAVRAISGVERVDARGYARTVAFEGGDALICVRVLTGEDALELRVRGAPPATLHALARAVLERRLDFSAAPEALAAALTALSGIGPWTAQYVALRALGEPDALPTGDLVLRRMAAPRHRMLSARELEERARDWRPWRGYAVMHLWSAAGNRGARIDNRRNQPARVRARA